MTMQSDTRPRVHAMARPGALPLPADRSVSAFTKPDVFTRWSEDAAALRASTAPAANVIEMYDVVGHDWWTGGGITAQKISEQLRPLRGQAVEVRLNSPGGDMFEGIAVYNVLREHDGEITVKVMGMAASAASIIAMAGDRIEIGAASFLMIHNCWIVAMGNRADLTALAAWLEPFDEAMAGVYVARSGQAIEQVTAWMDAETYMSGVTAVERGFADALLGADEAAPDPAARASGSEAASVRATEHALLASGMTRAQARAKIKEIRGKPDAAPEGTPDAADHQEWMQGAAALLDVFKARK
jgi:ATP-dependent Clp protease, protease subunit